MYVALYTPLPMCTVGRELRVPPSLLCNSIISQTANNLFSNFNTILQLHQYYNAVTFATAIRKLLQKKPY